MIATRAGWPLVCLSVCLAAAAPLCATLQSCTDVPGIYHIPGPNPLLQPRRAFNSTSWSGKECEIAGGLVQDKGEYFLIYHCQGAAGIYQVGMSSAHSPLGPWTPVDKDTPLLGLGANGTWEDQGVASFNMIPMPTKEQPDRWLGFYEGVSHSPKWAAKGWQMGTAESLNGPRGPWVKHSANPVMNASAVCDNPIGGGLRKRSFDGTTCNGMYIAAVHFGEHTGNKLRIYMEAPINQNDEGPMALWTAESATGPFRFEQYVLDGGLEPGPRGWDEGRYSESKVSFDQHSKLWHLWATGSPNGKGPGPSKYHENIGWAISTDGTNFTQYHGNPLALFSGSTPHTLAMSEGHSYIDWSAGLVYVFHTIRWDNALEQNWIDGNLGYYFVQPAGTARNAEDLGVEIFAMSPFFCIDVHKGGMPLITKHWERGAGLMLTPGRGPSACQYNWEAESICVPFVSHVSTQDGSLATVHPRLSFRVSGKTQAPGATPRVLLRLHEYDYDAGVGKAILLCEIRLATLVADGSREGYAEHLSVSNATASRWLVATLESTGVELFDVELFLGYDSTNNVMHVEGLP